MAEKPKDEGFCNDCPFQEPGEKDLRCHRLPPAACSDKMAFQWKFPRVEANWWCGEHPVRRENIEERYYTRESPREERE